MQTQGFYQKRGFPPLLFQKKPSNERTGNGGQEKILRFALLAGKKFHQLGSLGDHSTGFYKWKLILNLLVLSHFRLGGQSHRPPSRDGRSDGLDFWNNNGDNDRGHSPQRGGYGMSPTHWHSSQRFQSRAIPPVFQLRHWLRMTDIIRDTSFSAWMLGEGKMVRIPRVSYELGFDTGCFPMWSHCKVLDGCCKLRTKKKGILPHWVDPAQFQIKK